MHPTRLKPLTKEELSRGMTDDAIEKYFSLIKNLYDAFFFDSNEECYPLPKEEQHRKWMRREKIYKEIIKFLFVNDAISDDVYCELYKSMPIQYNYTEYPCNPHKFIGDSLEDFRLTFEYCLVESDDRINLNDDYLSERYGYGVCVRSDTPNRHVMASDLQVIRFENKSSDVRSVQASYWEVLQLLNKVRCDMRKNDEEQKLLDDILCKSKNASYIEYS